MHKTEQTDIGEKKTQIFLLTVLKMPLLLHIQFCDGLEFGVVLASV